MKKNKKETSFSALCGDVFFTAVTFWFAAFVVVVVTLEVGAFFWPLKWKQTNKKKLEKATTIKKIVHFLARGFSEPVKMEHNEW